jgi:membrane-associated phospholipid phosphatase
MSTEPWLRPVESGRRDTLARAAQVLVAWVLIVGIQVSVGKMLVGPLRGSVGIGDNNAERWLARHRTGTLTDLARALTLLGDTWTVIILAPVLLFITWLWLREVRAVVFLATAIVGEVAAYLVTVSLVSRLRPPVPLLDPGLDLHHSYPSGHTAASLAMYGGLAILIWIYGRPRWRALSVGLLVLPFIVAAARLYLGAHHPSDVVASLVFISGWLAVTATIVLTTEARRLIPARRGLARPEWK